MNRLAVWSGVLGLAVFSALAADSGVSAVGSFYAHGPEEGIPPVTATSFASAIHYRLKGANLSAGTHHYRCRIFDGDGREAFSISFNVSPNKAGEWQAWVNYTPSSGVDAPGTWWFASELDNKALLSQSITVSPSGKP